MVFWFVIGLEWLVMKTSPGTPGSSELVQRHMGTHVRVCVAFGRYAASVMRHTTFRFALDPTSDQAALLARHAGASRYAYNQSLRLVTDALATAQAGLPVTVPSSGFDLIKAFNAWKISEGAGRVSSSRRMAQPPRR
jgi:hypothetical protein